MRVGKMGMLAGCVIASFALPLLGQGSLGVGAPAQRVHQPYTAKYQVTSEQTLANGATITKETTELQVSDSQGRHRSEFTTPAQGEFLERTIFHINDPIARVDEMWVAPGKAVTVHKRPPITEQRSCWSYSNEEQERAAATPAAQVAGPVPEIGVPMVPARSQERQRTTEQLGVQIIQGVEAEGTRTTETTPIGAVGNDAPLVRTTETWRAKSLQLVVRSVTDDPRTGKRTRELVELNRSEPDPGLFELPDGYRVVTEEPHEVACSQ